MHREELSTVCMAHKASAVSQHAKTGKLHLNTDGTTLQQRKLGGVAVNGMVMSVNQLPDGSADSVIEDVSRELSKLRETAHSLGLPNTDAINWSLIQTSTSDSAATQKRLNRLMEILEKHFFWLLKHQSKIHVVPESIIQLMYWYTNAANSLASMVLLNMDVVFSVSRIFLI